MKNRWVILIVALLSLSLLLAACGKDPSVDNPDTDIQTDDPAQNVPDSTPDETTAPVEEIRIPVISGADYSGFMDFALERLSFPPFEFDYEFDTFVEGEY